MPPTTPGDDRARVPELHDQAEHAEASAAGRRSAGGRWRSRNCWRRVISHALGSAAPAVCRVTVAAVEARHVRPSSCRSRSSTSAAARSMSGGRASSASRSVNARLSVTASAASVALRCRALGERPRVGGGIRRGLLCRRIAVGPSPAGADTGWAAPMWVPGAMAATSAASVMRNPADAARAPDGATNTTTGARRRDHARDDRAGRFEQPTRRAQHEHGGARRASWRRASRTSLDELGGDRMDDAVVLGDDDARGRALRASCATAAGELGNQAQAEPDEGQVHRPTPPDDRGPGGTRGACHGSDDLIALIAPATGRWLAIRRRAGRRAGASCGGPCGPRPRRGWRAGS